MILIELFVPRGVLPEDERRHLGERLATGLMPEEDGAPAEAVESARAFTQVVIHEPETWLVGEHVITGDEPPRYVVRISVPGPWRKEMSPMVIPAVTRVLAEADPDPTRLYDQPHVWVQVVGIAEGSCGLYGQPMGSTDIVKVITQPYRDSVDAVRSEDLPPGTALDPVCGMTVSLSTAAKVLDHDGTTYAFCSSACHAAFVTDHAAAHQ